MFLCDWEAQVFAKYAYPQHVQYVSQILCALTLFIIECSVCATPRMQKCDRLFDDQECCIRGLRWQKEANDPDRPAHQGRNGSPTPQREDRHQDPEV